MADHYLHLPLDVVAAHAERFGLTLAEAEDDLTTTILQGRDADYPDTFGG